MHSLSLGNRAVLLKPGISKGRTVAKTVTNADEFVMQAKFVLSQTARCYLLIRVILQEINGEKRPEKTKD